jgi:hypothetical protein
MCGTGVVRAFATPIESLDLPAGFEAVHVAGWSVGVLAYVEYQSPSPLRYRELLWMPAAVKSVDRDGRARYGHYVARAYVDDERAARGGREIWGLPKAMARFVPREGAVEMFADDGAEMELAFEHSGPSLTLSTHVSTLQREGSSLVRFRADLSASTALAHLRVMRFSGETLAWRSWLQRRELPLLAVALTSFQSTMHPPERQPGAPVDPLFSSAPRASA